MWSRSYHIKVKGMAADAAWAVWTNVNQWASWQNDIEYAKLDGKFESGAVFDFKPKGGPRFKNQLMEVEAPHRFTDLTRFPGAQMRLTHQLTQQGDELEIKATVTITGPLAFIWRKLVVEGIADGFEDETRRFIEQVERSGRIPLQT